jgi:hypothetical protein
LAAQIGVDGSIWAAETAPRWFSARGEDLSARGEELSSRWTRRRWTALVSETVISGIHHVTLSVSDLDRSVEWLDKAMLTRDGVVVTKSSPRAVVGRLGLLVPPPPT